ncbi:MAG: hypothetical protein AB8B88_06510 [Devosiaceae bacterium]
MSLSDKSGEMLQALETHFAGNGQVLPGKMLHAPSLMIKGKDKKARGFVFATRDVLVMKLPRLRIDMLEGDGAGKRMTMGSREMKEWIALPPNNLALLTSLAEEACSFVASLP